MAACHFCFALGSWEVDPSILVKIGLKTIFLCIGFTKENWFENINAKFLKNI